MYSKKLKSRAKIMHRQGYGVGEICEKLRITRDTFNRWRKAGEWDSVDGESIRSLDEQINAILASIKQGEEMSEMQLRRLKGLTWSKRQLELCRNKKITKKQGPVKAPALDIKVIGDLRQKFLDLLYPYQRDILLDEERFRIWLKSRQIGMSFAAGGAIIINAMLRKTDQVVLSASQQQSNVVRIYAERWADQLGIELIPDGSYLVAPGGAYLKFLPSNFRTVQGHSGDLWLDEFAWHIRSDRIYSAAAPILTIGDRKLTIFSSPYTQTDKFGEIWNQTDNYRLFSRHKITINDAIKDGLDVRLEEIRELFDDDTFRMLYLCEFFSDEMALFNYQEVQDALDEDCLRMVDTKVEGGMDIGRYRDLSAIVLAEEIDREKEKHVYVRHLELLKKLEYYTQKMIISGLFENWKIRKFRIDRTGLGDNLTEDMIRQYGSRIEGVWFTREIKEELALSAKRLFETRRMHIPNDRDMIVQLHSIKKKPLATGITYDSDRNEQIKHADLAWALFLAVRRFGALRSRIIDKVRIFGSGRVA